MGNLAIKGYPTRGKEVIEILEMLGGKNRFQIEGFDKNRFYYIDKNQHIQNTCDALDYTQFNLEEFLKEFPYKVGDKVSIFKDTNLVFTIKSMTWDTFINEVVYRIETIEGIENHHHWVASELDPYLEQEKETIEEINIDRIGFNGDKAKLILPDGYKFKTEGKEVYVVKKQPKYPKTYGECAKELGYNQVMPTDHILGYRGTLLSFFQQLLICRDAYWKIAEDWKPEFRFGKKKYCIMTKDNKVISATVEETNRILVFPTEEMRDAFYENFKDLIEQCKKLL